MQGPRVTATHRFGYAAWMRVIARTLAALSLVTALCATAGAQTPVAFVDVTADAGLAFRHNNGAFGEKYLPETFGSGVLWLDVDDDGWPDLLFVNSTAWPGRAEPPTSPALYRNDGDGTFSDITSGSGLDVPLYGIGGAAADYDNDGHIDIYLTVLGPNRLLRGRGDGLFDDVTQHAGVGDPAFSTSALWFDYDKDGHLDLFVANYVKWSRETDLFCSLAGDTKSYCTPESYQGESPTLYRNRGDGTFENVTEAAGVRVPSSKGLGVAMLDADADGWVDVFVANDTQPNQLFRNRGNGTFEDIGVIAGVAFSDRGVARAGMGVDAADYDGSGRPSLVVGNFTAEMMALYHNEGNTLFIDDGARSGLGQATLSTLTFGCFFFDADLDGWLDIFAANGHVADDVERIRAGVTYAQRPQFFRNLGGGRFEEQRDGLRALEVPVVGRGAAFADADRDGDLDVVVTANGGSARLLRNDGERQHHLVRVRTVGVVSNRDGIGAVVAVAAGGRTRVQMVKTGSSFASQSERVLTFGLADATSVSTLTVTWPSGLVESLQDVGADQIITVEEGRGITSTTSISGPPR